MRAGIPILDSLAIVAEESNAKELKKVLNDIQQRAARRVELRRRDRAAPAGLPRLLHRGHPGVGAHRAARRRVRPARGVHAARHQRPPPGEELADLPELRLRPRDLRRDRHVGLRAAEVQGLLQEPRRAPAAADAHAAGLHRLHGRLLAGHRRRGVALVVVVGFARARRHAREAASGPDAAASCRRSARCSSSSPSSASAACSRHSCTPACRCPTRCRSRPTSTNQTVFIEKLADRA